GVGVGESGGVAPAYSLISDYFPPSQRARALAAFAFGIPLGTAAGTLVGGLLAARWGWQTAFIVVGLLGLLLAPLLRLTVRDPKRGASDAAAAAAATAAALTRTTPEAAPVARVEPVGPASSHVGTIAARTMLAVGAAAMAVGAVMYLVM